MTAQVRDFPVRWQQPGDESVQWRFFVQSFPNQVPPLEFDVLVRRIMAGADHAFARLKGSSQGSLARRVNTYVYRAAAPQTSDAAPEASVPDALRALRDAVDDLPRSWAEDHLPRLRAFLDDFGGVDLGGLPDADLAAHFERACAELGELWERHFLILFPAAAAVNEFERTYRDLFGQDGALTPYRLLGGVPNKTVEAGKALWRLSRLAADVPPVREVLERTEPEQVVPVLETAPEGRAFLAELRDFLRAYGQRGDMCSLTAESWLEDPAPVVRTIASYLRRPDSASPELTQRRAAEEREEAVGGVRARLAGYPRPVAELFEQLLSVAQVGTALTEEHTFYIDYGGVHQVRRIVLELGRRLVDRGALARREDVFMLGDEDLRAAFTAPGTVDVAAAVRANEDEMRRFAGVAPPPAIGSGAPPAMSPTFMAFMRNMSGMGGPPPGAVPPAEPGTVRGVPGSAGVVRGVVRVVRTLAESDRLGPGEILVAPTTAPPWTPLFAVAGGIVTDTGGVLSHCAVVAREYGVPTVVGAAGATSTLVDGQVVEVDGSTGVVRVVGGP
ncbi:PEP-utilizing enzyme [Saccharothrix sp. HUAS TT1]|uniref:PEP-utilizing enzyme n=1 Tax=unclassified Saccharothrix TaxID=2593673 RepID=UPI00345B79EA